MTPEHLTKTVLTFDQIAEFVLAHASSPTTTRQVEEAVEALVAHGIVETMWDENGCVSYRLTRHGADHAIDMAREEGW